MLWANCRRRENIRGSPDTRAASHGRIRFSAQPLTVGAGGYYSRQNWGFGRNDRCLGQHA